MKIGFVGAGNMGGAIVRGVSAAGGENEIFVFDTNAERAAEFARTGGVSAAGSLAELAAAADILVLCVKPNVIENVLEELAVLRKDGGAGKVYVSIAAGISFAFLQSKLGADAKIIRVMPNTPAMVGEGMSALVAGAGVSETERDAVFALFSALGKAVWVSEDYMDIVTGISGSAPAYAYMFIEGLIEAGVRGGLSKEAATTMAAQATLGAAKMVFANPDTPPAQLRENVCSPGGTTIEAVKVLEAEDFRGTIGKAVDACVARSREMTR